MADRIIQRELSRSDIEVAREQPLHPGFDIIRPLADRRADPVLHGTFQMLRVNRICMGIESQRIEDCADEPPSVDCVGLHGVHDHFHGDIFGSFSPAVVVRRHADHLICDLCFARKLGFRESRHVDYTATP